MKKLFSAVLALVLACSLLTGCTVETQEEKVDSGSNQYYLYYVNKDETKVVKERYQPEQESRVYAAGFYRYSECPGRKRR